MTKESIYFKPRLSTIMEVTRKLKNSSLIKSQQKLKKLNLDQSLSKQIQESSFADKSYVAQDVHDPKEIKDVMNYAVSLGVLEYPNGDYKQVTRRSKRIANMRARKQKLEKLNLDKSLSKQIVQKLSFADKSCVAQYVLDTKEIKDVMNYYAVPLGILEYPNGDYKQVTRRSERIANMRARKQKLEKLNLDKSLSKQIDQKLSFADKSCVAQDVLDPYKLVPRRSERIANMRARKQKLFEKGELKTVNSESHMKNIRKKPCLKHAGRHKYGRVRSNLTAWSKICKTYRS